MKKTIVLTFLFTGLNAFGAGGSDVGNPWPWDPSYNYNNSVAEIKTLLNSKKVADILGEHGEITSIAASGDSYIIKTPQCSLTAKVTYEQPVYPPVARVEIVQTDCP